MCRHPRWICLWAVVVCTLFAGLAGAVAPTIHDEAKFFSPDALKKANEQIREIYAKYGKDFLIETFPSVPADKLEKVKTMESKEKAEYFHKLAVERAKERVVNGVYILITREPKYLYIEITPSARETFDKEFYNHFRKVLFSNLGEDHFDAGLAAAVKTVQERLAGAVSK
jgi:TPM domain